MSKIAEILPLSPLQQGFLFHALYDDHAVDDYHIQLIYELSGSLDPERLHAAVHGILERHANLRAAFVHENMEQPRQIIPRDITVPWQFVDLSALDEDAKMQEVQSLVAADKQNRFDPARPPLLRFTLLRMHAERHLLIFKHHHILIDGWSIPILLDELLTLYRHHGDTATLLPVTPYRDYLAWVKRQDAEVARAAWRNYLNGLEEPCLLVAERPASMASTETCSIHVPQALTEALIQQARRQRLTINTLVQAAWGVLIGKLGGRDDVVFGITVSHRPPELAGVESMVGMMMNTVPMRMRLRPEQTLLDLLQHMQDQQASLIEHQHLSLTEIQRSMGLGELFDTHVVFQNTPAGNQDPESSEDRLQLTYFSRAGGDRSHYPLGLCAIPRASGLELRLGYRTDLFERAQVEVIGQRLQGLLEAFTADLQQRVG
ncbi:condensation domain-containing protein, partial [Dyella flagellata]